MGLGSMPQDTPHLLLTKHKWHLETDSCCFLKTHTNNNNVSQFQLLLRCGPPAVLRTVLWKAYGIHSILADATVISGLLLVIKGADGIGQFQGHLLLPIIHHHSFSTFLFWVMTAPWTHKINHHSRPARCLAFQKLSCCTKGMAQTWSLLLIPFKETAEAHGNPGRLDALKMQRASSTSCEGQRWIPQVSF